MTSKEMMFHRLQPDEIFINVAELGLTPDWKVCKKPKDWGMYYDICGYPNSSYYGERFRKQ